MGKIKETILAKKDRPVASTPHPSIRRYNRQNQASVENSRSGRNNRLTPSRSVNLRSLRRSGTKAGNRIGQFKQDIPASVVFRFKKKYKPVVGVTHEGGGMRKSKTSTKKLDVMTCSVRDSERIAQFELWEKEGKGKIVQRRRKTIWHEVGKQDQKTFKPTKPKR